MSDEPKKPRQVIIQLRGVRKCENESIYSLDSLVDAQIAELQKRQATGVFDQMDFRKLEVLVNMKEKLLGVKNDVKMNTSELDGKTQAEIEALVTAALDKIKE